MQADATTPGTLLDQHWWTDVVASVLAVVYKRMQQLATVRNNMQQGVQTDATSNIQQCCIRLRGALYSVDTVLLFKQSLAFR